MLRVHKTIVVLAALGVPLYAQEGPIVSPAMYFSDSTRTGKPFAKDPSVIEYRGAFYMYYSVPPRTTEHMDGASEANGWGIGIATSKDLLHWTKVGEVAPTQAVEQKGIAAPGARVIDGKVHLFYQTYGHGAHDAICHAISADGVHFDKDPSNPVYRPESMPWSVGRAIDAEVYVVRERVDLYFATRDPTMARQMIGLASAPLYSGFSRGDWEDESTTAPLLQPTLPWEQKCIEAPTVMHRKKLYFMFYAGAYNNTPQQIGVASSRDAMHWTRLAQTPFLPNGKPGSWNAFESGYPGVLVTHGRTFLFFQGNNDGGKTYFLSKVEIGWHEDTPYVLPDSSGATVQLDGR